MFVLSIPSLYNIIGSKTSYPNGYTGGYIQRQIPKELINIQETIPYIVLPLFVQSDYFKIANGYLYSLLGWDIRYETLGGSKLYHEDISYDGVTGTKCAWVRFTSLEPGADLGLKIFFGKAGLTESEEEPIKCWNGYLASIELSTGFDRSGNNADLSLFGVAATTLNSLRAGNFSELAEDVDRIITSDNDGLVTSIGHKLVWGNL